MLWREMLNFTVPEAPTAPALTPEEAPSNLAIASRYVMTPEIFGFLHSGKPGKGGEIQLTDAMRALCETANTLGTFFNGQKWEGQLRAIIPGDGYYFYNSGPTRTFHYPAVDGSNRSPVKAPAEQGWMPFTPVDHHMFSDNMNVIAQVRDGNQAIDTLAIGAFVGGECRGAVRCTGGLYYLTIAGNTNENNLPIELHAFIDGEERVIDNDLVFVVDVIVGTPDAPYVININGSGVDDMTVADARIRITPTVTQGPVKVSTGEGLAAVRLYSASGALLESHNPHGAEILELDLAGRDNGFYIVEAVSMNGQRRSQRVVRSPR